MTRINDKIEVTSENTTISKKKRVNKSSDKNSVETGSTIIGKRSTRSKNENDGSLPLPFEYQGTPE